MPEPKRPLKVFLCHAHADRDAVRALYTRLTNDGVDAWLDKAKLLPGQDWELEIRKAVREADVVVVCLSKQFNQAGFRQKEVRLALDTAMEKPEGEIFIIPARLEECDNLESLRKWHWVDLFEDDGYEMLMRALRTRADRIGVTLQIKKKWLPKVNSRPETTKNPERPDEKKRRNRTKPNYIYFVGGILFIVLILVSFFGLPPFFDQLKINTTVTNTERAITSPTVFFDQTLQPSEPPIISTITQSPPPSVTASPTSLPTEITDIKGVSMVLVPEGEFIFGSDSGTGDEFPSRKVFLPNYYIDKYEVTNARYRECEQSHVCKTPIETKFGKIEYYGNSKYDLYPVIYVNIERAIQYCSWRDTRLPSSYEWEKAARGVDGRIYPWGNEIGSEPRANSLGSSDNYEATSPVGSFSSGASPYGVFDMSGNVSEFVSDYGESWDFVDYPMYRGGSWFYRNEDALTVLHWGLATKYYSSYSDLGFRCAKDTP